MCIFCFSASCNIWPEFTGITETLHLPETQQQHVIEFVFTQGPRHSDEERLSKQWRAGVVVARLFVLLSQVDRNHHVFRVLHPVDRHLKSEIKKKGHRDRAFQITLYLHP